MRSYCEGYCEGSHDDDVRPVHKRKTTKDHTIKGGQSAENILDDLHLNHDLHPLKLCLPVGKP